MVIDCIGDLLPCPFCDSKKLRVVKLPRISKDFKAFTMIPSRVDCLGCGAGGPEIAYVKDIKEAWNLRRRATK